MGKERDLLLSLKNQLEKDLQIAIESANPEDLVNSVHDHLRHKATEASYLQSILYRVDVSEAQLAEAFRTRSWSEPEIITWCILEREWQKVQFRKNYPS